MSSLGVTLANNTIIIEDDGTYRIDYLLSLASGGLSFGIQIGVLQNGIEIPSTYTNSVTPGQAIDSVSVSSFVALTAGDVLTLEVYSVTGGTLVFAPELCASLSVMRLNN
ncbi:MAG: hypothetical protein PHN72_05110 [Bacilli bacterium]|nr:hypothetical protein [Bacilli bacterium]